MLNHLETSLDVVACIAKANPDIYITFSTYPQPPKNNPTPIRSLAELRGKLLIHKENTNLRPRLTNYITRQKILQLCCRHDGKCLAIRSLLHKRAIHSEAHEQSPSTLVLPLLDFVCKKRKKLKRLLVELLTDVNELEQLGGGFLLETTNSYHYYGKTAINTEKWLRFIGHCLLLHPRPHDLKPAMRLGASTVIDARFLGHSLLAGQGSLRVSPDRDGQFPRVVALIEPVGNSLTEEIGRNDVASAAPSKCRKSLFAFRGERSGRATR